MLPPSSRDQDSRFAHRCNRLSKPWHRLALDMLAQQTLDVNGKFRIVYVRVNRVQPVCIGLLEGRFKRLEQRLVRYRVPKCLAWRIECRDSPQRQDEIDRSRCGVELPR